MQQYSELHIASVNKRIEKYTEGPYTQLSVEDQITLNTLWELRTAYIDLIYYQSKFQHIKSLVEDVE